MSIFRDRSTPQWGLWVKSLRDIQMASISNKPALAMTQVVAAHGFVRYVRHLDASGVPATEYGP